MRSQIPNIGQISILFNSRQILPCVQPTVAKTARERHYVDGWSPSVKTSTTYQSAHWAPLLLPPPPLRHSDAAAPLRRSPAPPLPPVRRSGEGAVRPHRSHAWLAAWQRPIVIFVAARSCGGPVAAVDFFYRAAFLISRHHVRLLVFSSSHALRYRCRPP